MPILVDFSQVSIGVLTADAYTSKQTVTFDVGYARHLIINLLRTYRQKYYRQYGELIIATDSSNGYWRKDIFPYYKASRKADKEKSNIDWESVKVCLNTVRDELKEYFPYPVISVPKAEGDDCIGVLCEYFHTNELITDGMWEDTPQSILILSADGDLVQNQRFKNVQQYSPKMKKFLRPEGQTVDQFLLEHIAEGDSGDGIPNTLSVDNCFVDKIRQKSLKKDRRAEFIEKGIDACQTEEERKFYTRNQTLIDFQYIPLEIKNNIIAEYQKQRKACEFRGRKKVMNYLIKNRMGLLIDHLSDF